MEKQSSTSRVLQAIRARPGMYIGSRDEAGVEHLIYELVANGIDLFLAGLATTVAVRVAGDEITVSDDGPGLPFDETQRDGRSLAEHWLSELRDTPTADGHHPHVHLNGAGLGLVVVTALSNSLQVFSHRCQHRWEQRFEKGSPHGTAAKDAVHWHWHLSDFRARSRGARGNLAACLHAAAQAF